MINSEYNSASQIKKKKTRKIVQNALSRLYSTIRGTNEMPKNGIAFFFGFDGENEYSEYIIPPLPISSKFYICDTKFNTKPLRQQINQNSSIGLISIDRSGISLSQIIGKKVDMIYEKDSNVPSKHKRGGQSSQRFERGIEGLANRHFKKSSTIISNKMKNHDVIILGGNAFAHEKLVKYLSVKITKKIIGTFSLAYSGEIGLRELMQKSQSILSDYEIGLDLEILDKFYLAMAYDKVVYGNQILNHLKRGIIDILIVSESLPFNQLSELQKISNRYSTNVVSVSSKHEDGQIFNKTFGGIAGILRY